MSKSVSLFSDPEWVSRFPPILTVDQAADLMTVPKATIYAWSSRGLLDECSARAGKHLRILRDEFIKKFLSGGFNNGKSKR